MRRRDFIATLGRDFEALAGKLVMSAARAAIFMVGLLAVAGVAPYAVAQQPSYLILKPTTFVEKDCDTSKWKPSKNVYVSRTPYAYGYFGATASTKWSRSTNYHRSYTQWQRR